MESAFHVAGLLELVATERPELLAPLVEALEYSPARPGLVQVAKVWGVRPEDLAADLGAVAAKASKHLDRLEHRRPGTWRHPAQVVDSPNVEALATVADARHGRAEGIARAKRLNILRRKLGRAAEVERARRELGAFLQAPSKPVDLAAFMGWGDE